MLQVILDIPISFPGWNQCREPFSSHGEKSKSDFQKLIGSQVLDVGGETTLTDSQTGVQRVSAVSKHKYLLNHSLREESPFFESSRQSVERGQCA